MLLTSSTDDGRGFLRRDNSLRMTEVFDRRILELVARLIGDERRTREDGEISEYFFLPIAKSWSLDSEDSENSLEFVENNPRQCLSIYIISDDDEFTTTRLSE